MKEKTMFANEAVLKIDERDPKKTLALIFRTAPFSFLGQTFVFFNLFCDENKKCTKKGLHMLPTWAILIPSDACRNFCVRFFIRGTGF